MERQHSRASSGRAADPLYISIKNHNKAVSRTRGAGHLQNHFMYVNMWFRAYATMFGLEMII